MGHSESSERAAGVPGPADAGLGRRARKARATRLALFEAGLAAFENRPLGVVSVLDLTEACDVAKGVFYLHFRGKDEYLIELWDFVQEAFLAGARGHAERSGSRRARTEAVAGYHFRRIDESPRECRFWLRMASYFGDEIGEPGRMHHLRQQYLRELAALLASVAPADVGAPELRAAGIVDGTCWGLISRALQLGGGPLDEAVFVRSVTGALRSVDRLPVR